MITLRTSKSMRCPKGIDLMISGCRPSHLPLANALLGIAQLSPTKSFDTIRRQPQHHKLANLLEEPCAVG